MEDFKYSGSTVQSNRVSGKEVKKYVKSGKRERPNQEDLEMYRGGIVTILAEG